MEDNILWFKHIDKTINPFLGDKSKRIALLYSNGFPIPHGFIIPAKVYNLFLEKTQIKDNIRILMQNIDVNDRHEVQARANEVQRLIVMTELPIELKNEIIEAYKSLDMNQSRVKDFLNTKARDILVAIRNDPVPGYNFDRDSEDLHLSFLNIKGDKLLIRAVQASWASLFTANAVEYRAKKNINQLFCSMSVIVQRMLPIRKSGILVTTLETDSNLASIKACLGLIKSPDGKLAVTSEYVIDTDTLQIKSKQLRQQDQRFVFDEDDAKYIEEDITELPNRNPLVDSEISELAIFGKQIENFFGAPQEIEWAYYNKFYILNVKPLIKFAPEQINDSVSKEISKEIVEEDIKHEGITKHEEIDILFDENKNEIQIKEHIEVNGVMNNDKTIKFNPQKFISDSKKAANSILPIIHDALEHALRLKENDTQSNVNDLLQKQDYPNKHELELVLKMQQNFVGEKNISFEDLKHALESVEKFIEYLNDHKFI